MTGVVILDPFAADNFEKLAPHFNLLSTATPGDLRHIADLPGPSVQNIFNFINSEVMVIK